MTPRFDVRAVVRRTDTERLQMSLRMALLRTFARSAQLRPFLHFFTTTEGRGRKSELERAHIFVFGFVGPPRFQRVEQFGPLPKVHLIMRAIAANEEGTSGVFRLQKQRPGCGQQADGGRTHGGSLQTVGFLNKDVGSTRHSGAFLRGKKKQLHSIVQHGPRNKSNNESNELMCARHEVSLQG